ncbi:MAG TPA: ribonuclease III [Pseudomonadales bacterium]|nr:ribonuclease III [Pseudomonadales bacterium]
MNETLNSLQHRLAYTFVSQPLIVQALTHRSYGVLHNERLEFLGDAILDLFIGEFLYQQFSAATEGELSHMRAQAVCGERLTEIGQQLQLGDCLFLGAGEAKSGGRQRESNIANAVEAVIAAIYLDGGIESCRAVVLRLFAPILAQLMEQGAIKDAKTRLQEYLQSRHLPLPQYRLLTRTGMDHNASFTMECEVLALNISAVSIASSRKKAEQLAAEEVFKQLELLREQ